jgi:release factor glutamine methyltransferase
VNNVNCVRDCVNSASHRLRAAGIPHAEAGLDARLLACDVLGWDLAKYLTSSEEGPPAGFEERFEAVVARREAREPMAYILGRQEFWGRDFAVAPAVLIPRPETELIVETALELFPDRQAALNMADIGTGSGCLAVTLAAEFPNATIIATDVSGPALAVAEHNARRLNVADRIGFAQADVLAVSSTTFDLIVSNPPYVRDTDRQTLPPEVILHEPASSLFGGADGLDVIRRVVTEAGRALRPSGFLLVEFGVGQADQIAELISAAPGLTMVGLKRDLQGIPRIAVARTGSPA